MDHSFLNFLGASSTFFSTSCSANSFWLVKMDPTFITRNSSLGYGITNLLILSKEVECHPHAIFLMFSHALSRKPVHTNFSHFGNARTTIASSVSHEKCAAIFYHMSVIVKMTIIFEKSIYASHSLSSCIVCTPFSEHQLHLWTFLRFITFSSL